MTETQMVNAWRSKGYGWQSISNMLRRAIEDVRRDHDPGFAGGFYPQPLKPVTGARKPMDGRAWTTLGPNKRRQLIMDTLYHATLPVPMNDLGGYTAAMCIDSMRKKFGRDFIRSKQYHGYWLTEKGRQVYQQYFAREKAA